MTPVVTIVGRPNVGKSSLFNCLTRSRDALVADSEGVTRDRIYGQAVIPSDEDRDSERPFIVIDTGGLCGESSDIADLTEQQVQQAIHEATVILFIVDGRVGLQAGDQNIAAQLRSSGKPVIVVMNKMDGIDADSAVADFYTLGFSEIIMIAAAHRRGINKLMTKLELVFPREEVVEALASPDDASSQRIKVALIGRPNVGKSTLTNRLLGEERVMVCDMPGTTRDSVFIPFHFRGRDYTLIDTAGVRRRSKIKQSLEQLSIIKTLQAISAAHVVILVVDARTGIEDQDLKLLGLVLRAGRSIIIAINKWDGMSPYDRQQVKNELDRRLSFVPYAEVHFISALHGTGVGTLLSVASQCYDSATRPLQTSELTAVLEQAVLDHQPPLAKGRRIKLRYAHLGGHHPPTIIIHGNQVDKLPSSYVRYLENVYRKAFKLLGVPIKIILRRGDNPFVKTQSKC